MSDETTPLNETVRAEDVEQDFTSSHDFVMGEIYGLRGWTVDEKGRLTGVSMPEVWKPGVNTSKCGYGRDQIFNPWEDDYSYSSSEAKYFFTQDEWGNTIKKSLSAYLPAGREKPKPKPKPKHKLSSCSCGFHAYFSTHSNESKWGELQGVIRAFGQTTIGTKGFRAEKAEILALTVPGPSSALLKFRWVLSLFARISPSRYFFGGSVRAGVLGHDALAGLSFCLAFVLSVAALVMTAGSAIDSNDNGGVFWLGLFFVFMAVYLWSILGTDDMDWKRPPKAGYLLPKKTEMTFSTLSRQEKIDHLKKLYPDVKIYSYRRAMLRAHPVSKLTDFLAPQEAVKSAELPTPETDPDFWS